MPRRTVRPLFSLLLVLVILLLCLVACGEEEGQQARATVDQAGENAIDFAEGFCGAIVLVPLCLGAAVTARRSRQR